MSDDDEAARRKARAEDIRRQIRKLTGKDGPQGPSAPPRSPRELTDRPPPGKPKA